jgi:hypothetical protein
MMQTVLDSRLEDGPRLGPAAKVVAWSLPGVSVLLSIASFAFTPAIEFSTNAVFTAIFLPTAVLGAVILSRSSSHRIGWMLAVIGTLAILMGFSGSYSTYAFLQNPGSALPLRWPMAWLNHWAWLPILGTVIMVLPQIFPTGRPLSKGWSGVLWLTIASVVLISLLLAFGRMPIEIGDTEITNPYGFIPIDRLSGSMEAAIEMAIGVMLIGIPLASVISLVVRFRRSRGDERQQIKWIVFALGLVVGSFAAGAIASIALEGDCCALDTAPLLDLLSELATVALPVSIALSILKYRLYDIDLLIKRSLVYGVLITLLGVVYYLGVLVLQRVLPSESPLSTVLSTLAIAALFSPLRRRVRTAIDKRFYRQRYEPEQTLALFSDELQDQVDPEEISKSLLRFAEDTVQPEHASVWLRYI